MDPPVPIPNTEVKLRSADDTASARVWENRSPPGDYFCEKAHGNVGFLFACKTTYSSFESLKLRFFELITQITEIKCMIDCLKVIIITCSCC